MNIDITDDQRALQEVCARMLRTESSTARVRAAEAAGFDPSLWQHLVSTGIITLRAPAPHGNEGSLLDAVVVSGEIGRHLASGPVLEAMVAAGVLGQVGGAGEGCLSRMAQGAVVTLALQPLQEAARQIVPGAGVAEAVLALDRDALVLLSGFAHQPPPPHLGGTAMASLTLSGSGFTGGRLVLLEGVQAQALYEAALEEWKLLTAAAAVGAAQQALLLACDYAKTRQQFGRPIGSFQGLAHPLADAATDIDGAQLLVWRAVWSIAEAQAQAGAEVSMAYWWATQVSDRAIHRCVRAFGGYGVALEYDVQLYYKRAKAWSLMLGDPRKELQRAGDRLYAGFKAHLPDAGLCELNFDYGREAQAFADAIRAFIDANTDAQSKALFHHSSKGHMPAFHRKMAQAGYLFPELPPELGGQGRSRYDMLAAGEVWEEIGWTNVPARVTYFLARVLMQWGTEEAKDEILPQMLAGEALGCLGFSEPSSGSDVFNAKLKAVRDGDEWVINGQKMFTTNGHQSDYILLLARTRTDGAKHQGLTMFAMPMKVAGVEVQPVHTLQDERTNITYFSDARVHDRYRLGEVDGGLAVMQSALNIEHGGSGYQFAHRSMFRHAVAWAHEVAGDGAGTRPVDDPEVRERLAQAAVLCQVGDALCRRDVWADEAGKRQAHYGPMAKMFTTEALARSAADLVALAAPASLLWKKDHLGSVELMMRRALSMTIYGGTSEIHRSLIAEQGLGLPRTRT